MTHEQLWYVALGRQLWAARTERGMTIYDVAAVVDSTGNAVSLWERGLRRMKAWQYAILRAEGLVR